MKFLLVLVILKINLIILLPSVDIWNKVQQYIKEGIMNDFNKKYFIFIEENYTALDVNSEKMQDLYNKQEQIYNNYGITSYIFAVKNINKFIEEIGKIRNKTRDNLRKGGYDVDNSIITVFSIESRQGKIYIGNNTKEKCITDDNAIYMKNRIINNLKNESNNYNTLKDYLDDINYFCNKSKNSEPTIYNTRSYKRRENNKNSDIIIGTIISIGFVLVTVGLVICCCKFCKNCKNNNNGNDSYNNDNSVANYSSKSDGGNNVNAGGNKV